MTQDDLRAALRTMREGARLTQRQLATMVGRTQGWVNKVETGQRGIDLDVVELWAQGCRQHVHLLVGAPSPIDAVADLSPDDADLLRRAAEVLRGPETFRAAGLRGALRGLLDAPPVAQQRIGS